MNIHEHQAKDLIKKFVDKLDAHVALSSDDHGYSRHDEGVSQHHKVFLEEVVILLKVKVAEGFFDLVFIKVGVHVYLIRSP